MKIVALQVIELDHCSVGKVFEIWINLHLQYCGLIEQKQKCVVFRKQKVSTYLDIIIGSIYCNLHALIMV